MNTQENNRLIAEFMQIKYEGGWNHSTLKNLQYHTSWDWLMPVVEKIRQRAYNKEIPVSDVEISCAVSRVSGLSVFCRINQVYAEVVKFIHWHNSTQQN